MGNGYWRQRCENGDVWTRNGASEKYIVMLNLRKEYYAKGGFSKLEARFRRSVIWARSGGRISRKGRFTHVRMVF